MKIQILSDLHHEYDDLSESAKKKYESDYLSDADVVIFAGDIDIGTKGLEWAGFHCDITEKLGVYVAGNHEFYYQKYDQTLSHLKSIADSEGIAFLECSEFIHQDVRFIGCTLWSDFRITGDADRAMAFSTRSINDYRLIQVPDTEATNWWPEPWKSEIDFSAIRYRTLTPEDSRLIHSKSREWLQQTLEKPFSGKTVVITHHGPSPACQHPDFPVDEVSANFWSNLEPLVEKSDLWVFGHTHTSLDTQINGTRLVTNQRGYSHPGGLVHGFDGGFCIEL